jgi:hypothetical protein
MFKWTCKYRIDFVYSFLLDEYPRIACINWRKLCAVFVCVYVLRAGMRMAAV